MSKLWVKETWATEKRFDSLRPKDIPADSMVWYLADGPKPEWCGKTRSFRFMPRWASRITLEITGVRVERVQDISEYDAEQEGVKVSHYYCDEGEFPMHRCDPVGKFQELWDSINAKRGYGWQTNPYVWVIEFKRLEPVRELTPEEVKGWGLDYS